MPIEIKEPSNCCGCYSCMNVCPMCCISMNTDAEGFWYPQVDEEHCIQCNLCEQVCPIKSQTKEPDNVSPKAYVAINTNDYVRLHSSSGGIFSLLAKKILEDSGVVFGAAMTKDWRETEHIIVKDQDELWLLQGSKYIQSKIGDTYKQAKQELDGGSRLMFVGTPCQIEGLRSFLHKEYDSLLCVDFACHGVPSPKVWEKYVSYREKCARASTEYVSFRNKDLGWRSYSLFFRFSNRKQYRKLHEDDCFMRLYLSNICLRPSCYSCHFKKRNRLSDITLADCWGVERLQPSLDDDQGVSLILVHSEKGEKAFAEIATDCVFKKVDSEQAIEKNLMIIHSATKHPQRSKFFKKMDELQLNRAVKLFTPQKKTFKVRIVSMLKRAGSWDMIQHIREKIK